MTKKFWQWFYYSILTFHKAYIFEGTAEEFQKHLEAVPGIELEELYVGKSSDKHKKYEITRPRSIFVDALAHRLINTIHIFYLEYSSISEQEQKVKMWTTINLWPYGFGFIFIMTIVFQVTGDPWADGALITGLFVVIALLLNWMDKLDKKGLTKTIKRHTRLSPARGF